MMVLLLYCGVIVKRVMQRFINRFGISLLFLIGLTLVTTRFFENKNLFYIPRDLLITSVIYLAIIEAVSPHTYVKDTLKIRVRNIVISILNVILLGILLKRYLIGLANEVGFYNIFINMVGELHFVIQAFLAFLLIDFLKYFLHTLHHRYKFFWRFHKVHHSVEDVNITNGFYSHPVDYAIRHVTPVVFAFCLGFRAEALILAHVFSMISIPSHSGAKISAPILSAFICTPEVHRIHHIKHVDNKIGYNFGSALCIWDRIFGSYRYDPDKEKKLELGVPK